MSELTNYIKCHIADIKIVPAENQITISVPHLPILIITGTGEDRRNWVNALEKLFDEVEDV